MSLLTSSSHRPNRTPSYKAGGFSLLGIILTLAILAIMAAVLTPRLIKWIDNEYHAQEQDLMERMAGGLKDYARSQRAIPGSSDWSIAIASEVDADFPRLERNTRGNDRRFLIDPDFWAPGDNSLPYTQTADGRPSRPYSPRFIILNSIHDPLPSGSLDFGELWATPEGELPSGDPAWDSWPGEGRDLNIQRIHLGDQFHRLLIQNLDGSMDAQFAIDDSDLVDAPELPWVRYFIDGTTLRLHDLGDDPTEVTRIIIDEDMAYYYDQGMWQRDAGYHGPKDWIESLVWDLRHWIDENNYHMNDLKFNMKNQQFQISAP